MAEDHVVARVGVATIVNSQADMVVIAEAINGGQAVEYYRKYRPDIGIVDMRMPILSGPEAVSAIRAEFPDARLIALTSYAGDADIRRALAAGVGAYLTKDAPSEELLNAIRSVAAGNKYLNAAAMFAQAAAPQSGPELSDRELQVLELVVRGLFNKQIAHTLNLAEYTVKNYVKSILRKLDVQDRTQAATEAIRRGIIHVPW